jgi:hypothetical protein
MATKKELQATQGLIAAAIAVNSSNEDVNISVEVQRNCVQLRISPDKEVGNPVWDWLFYSSNGAYFSDDIFSEEAFLKRCDVFLAEINKHMISRDADGVPV